MDDDIYGDLEVSSSSSSTDDEKVRAKKSQNQSEQNDPPLPPEEDDADSKKINSLRPEKKHEESSSGDLDTMDLMDEGLTSKFKETPKYKSTDYTRTRAPAAARSNDIQLEKVRFFFFYWISQLLKIIRRYSIQWRTNYSLFFFYFCHFIYSVTTRKC